MRIVRYITIFRDAGDFWPYRLSRRPCRRRWCVLPRLDFGSDWTTGTAALVSRGLTSSAICRSRGISRFYRRRKLLALSPPLSPPRGARSPRAPLDIRSSDFGISWVYEDHFKAEMRGFPTSHLRASSGAVECNRRQRQVGPQPRLQLHSRPHFL